MTNSFLPPESQPWSREVEARLSALELQDSATNAAINGINATLSATQQALRQVSQQQATLSAQQAALAAQQATLAAQQLQMNSAVTATQAEGEWFNNGSYTLDASLVAPPWATTATVLSTFSVSADAEVAQCSIDGGFSMFVGGVDVSRYGYVSAQAIAASIAAGGNTGTQYYTGSVAGGQTVLARLEGYRTNNSVQTVTNASVQLTVFWSAA